MSSIRLIFLVVILFFAATALAGTSKIYGDVVVSEVTSIYDGDTFRCNIAGYPPLVRERISIRINGIDTPEMRHSRPTVKALGHKAKQYTVQWLREGRQIVLRNMQRGKYFRIVADVYVDRRSLGRELIRKGLAKPYYGGKKPKW